MHMRAKHRRDRKPIVSKLPAPSRHRPPTLSQTLRASRCSPFTVSRWLKICPIIRPRQHMCKRRCGRIPKVGKPPAPSRHYFESADSCAPVRIASSRVDPPATFADRALAPCHTKGSRNQGQKIACAIAVALSDTLTDCTRQPAHSRRRFSMVENRPLPPLSRVTTNSGAASASGTRYFQDARPYPHPSPEPSPIRVAMRSIPSTPRHEHRLRRVRCTCMRP